MIRTLQILVKKLSVEVENVSRMLITSLTTSLLFCTYEMFPRNTYAVRVNVKSLVNS